MNLETLVLNADHRPLSIFPLSAWHWKDAVTALILGRVDLVANYDEVVHSPRTSMHVPSVVALKRYMPMQGRPAFTRYNIYVRDRLTCQYCGGRFAPGELTFDHVVPRSRGGRTTWENVVAACAPCNLTKANRTPEEAGMRLLRPAFQPTRRELAFMSGMRHLNDVHRTWRDYLYWDSELEA